MRKLKNYMATIREIKRRIKSAKNISQVTRAMEMVSAVRMKKAQESALAGRAYIDELSSMVGILSGRKDLEETSPLLILPKEVKRLLLVVVGPKKGLCGPLVSNLFRQLTSELGAKKDLEFSFVTVEKKSRDVVKTTGHRMSADFNISGKTISIEDVRPISDYLVQQFVQGQADKVLVLYTHFVSTVSQKATVKQFLPAMPPMETDKQEALEQSILFEPSQSEVLNELLVRYCEAGLYQIILEAAASEHSARMVAMKNAHDSASGIISDLTLFYNKARQNAITNELADTMSSRLSA